MKTIYDKKNAINQRRVIASLLTISLLTGTTALGIQISAEEKTVEKFLTNVTATVSVTKTYLQKFSVFLTLLIVR